MTNDDRLAAVTRFIDAYNRFDIDSMIAEVSADVRFTNVSGGSIDLETTGIEAFREQAESAARLFSERRQQIVGVEFGDETVEVEIAYAATLAGDIAGGPPAGDRIELAGRSVYTFSGGKIAGIVDIS